MSEIKAEPTAAGSPSPDGEATSYDSVAGLVAQSGLWSVGGQVAALVAALIATPFTIRLLKPASYGLLSLLQSVQNWIGLADFGMGTASTRVAGERHAQQDAAGEASTTWTAVAITSVATCVIVTAVAIAAPFVVKSVLHVSGNLVVPGEIAVRLTAAVCVTTVLANSLNTPLLVRLRWRELTLITAVSSLGGIILVPLALATFGGGVITATDISLALGIVSVVLMALMAVKLQPLMRRPRLSRSAARTLLHYGAALTVGGFANIPLTTADRLLLSHYRGVMPVAYYVVAWRLAALLTVFPLAISKPLFPGFVMLQGSGQMDAMRALYRQALQGLFLLLTPAMLLLVFVAHPFLKLWAGELYGARSTHLFYIMVVGVWFDAAGWLPAYFLSLDHMKQFARVRVVEVIPYVAATAILASRFGAIGAAAAWSGRLVIDASVLFLLARRHGGVTISPLSSNRVRSVLFPLTLGGVLLLLGAVTGSLPTRAGYAVAVSVLYAALVWRLVLTQRERDGLSALSPLRRFARPRTAS
ncbi:MAG: oligosaccharide flippase family protein [Trebonia sp.]